jgi:hypothetical protein
MPLSEDYLKSVSESELKDRAFTPFELQKHERESLEEIRRLIKLNKYKDKNNLMESIEFIEKLANRMTIALTNEKKDGKANWELDSDIVDVKKIFDQLNILYQNIETVEVDTAVKNSGKKKPRTKTG